MSGSKACFDTNVILYAFAQDDPRTATAEALLAAGGVVGVQSLNEFVAVALRKLAMPWEEVVEALDAIRALCPSPIPLTIATHDRAVRIARRHGYHIYDSLIIACALEASCTVLYSEDMQDGKVIEGLTVRNPFKKR